ncbi:MAG: hypothetical protein IJW62_05120 [Clostridia bacterium]|nr:hypothetical protein [Clostridia bacterium]
MKKYCSVLLAVVMLGLGGCNSVSSEPQQTASTTADEIEYTIYYSSEATLRERPARKETTGEKAPEIDYVRAETKKFDLLTQSEIDPNPNAVPSRTVSIDGKEITVNYQNSYAGALSECNVDKLKEKAFFDRYAINEPGVNGTKISVKFFRSSGKISNYIDYNACEAEGGDLTEEQAIHKAEAELIALYGEDILPRYALENASISDNVINITYRHYICGYKTTEFILLTYNLQGQLASVSFANPDLFASVEDQITVEAIQKAEPLLRESIPDGLDTIGTMIVMDAEGVAYLRINGYRTDDTGYRYYCEYFINLY